MRSYAARRSLFAFALAAFLAAPQVIAAPLNPLPVIASPGVGVQSSGWLYSLWAMATTIPVSLLHQLGGPFPGIRPEAGCVADPSGPCASAAPPVHRSAGGCVADPDRGCGPSR
jgi:hypothetical protein